MPLKTQFRIISIMECFPMSFPQNEVSNASAGALVKDYPNGFNVLDLSIV